MVYRVAGIDRGCLLRGHEVVVSHDGFCHTKLLSENIYISS